MTWCRAAALLAAIAALLAGGCATVGDADRAVIGRAEAVRHSFVGTAMGSRVEITIDEDDADHARRAARAAQIELDRLDALLSDWRADSALSAWNRDAAAGPGPDVPSEMRDLARRALDIARATEGRFDPTVLPCVRLWRAARENGVLPDAAALSEARALVDWQALSVTDSGIARARAGIELDFGGIGKGFGAVRALEVLHAAGCPRALVAIAGDVAAGDAPRGEAGWTVEIVPQSAATPAETVVLARAAVSTSGAAVQWVEIDGTRYAHVVDPRTGLGARNLAQATVVGPLDAAVDALATALALAESETSARSMLAAFPGFRARIERDGRADWLAWPESGR